MIPAVLLAAVLVAAPVVPVRGDSDVALVHVSGWHQFSQISADYPTRLEYAPPEQDWAATLPAGEWVDVYFGGFCSIDGVKHLSTPLRRATCYGSGG
jgi:hypothetical protein